MDVVVHSFQRNDWAVDKNESGIERLRWVLV